MKNNNMNWMFLIGVALVVAVVASLITAGITGNVIRVNGDGKLGKFKVYTINETYNKSEVDALVNPLVNPLTKPSPTCNILYSIIRSSWHSNCFDKDYNQRADYDKNGFVGTADYSWFSTNFRNETWCESQLIKRDNPCLGYPSYPNLIFDIDDNSIVDDNTDGKLITRYLMDKNVPWSMDDAMGVNAKRNNQEKIFEYLDCLSNKSVLDVDGDGKLSPSTDGILVVRYISSFPVVNLTRGAISRNATRTTPAEVLSFLNDPPGYDGECDKI